MARYGDLDTQYFNDAGDPLVNGKIFFFETGTTTPKTTFADVNFTIPNPNPVILTAAGRQPNIFFQGVAKAILATSAGVQILVRDPVGETAATFGNPWVASKDYNANDVVQGSNGDFYVSLINGNVNNNPVNTTGSWTYLYSVEWNQGTTYKEGSVVTYESIVYQSLQNANINQNPLTQTAFWVAIQLSYISTQTYALHANVVGTDGVLYTSLQAANVGNTPASSPTFWVGTSAAAAASASAALASENAADADAIATAADRVQTGLDAAATAADAIATAADAVQTGLDAAATAADVILTDADAVATAADRVQTGLDAAATAADAIATAADAVQTGLDVIATNADAVSTAADAIATAADAAQTGLDAIATAADAVQTGLDAASASSSASSASTSATTATTQAGIATTQAGIATTQASNATTQANAASASAAAAAEIVNISEVQTFTNPLAQAVSVQMTAATTVASIRAPSDPNTRISTNNFTIHCNETIYGRGHLLYASRVSVDDRVVLGVSAASDNFLFLAVIGGVTIYNITLLSNFSAYYEQNIDVDFVMQRETATQNGAWTLFVNGVAISNGSITAAATADISVNAPVFFNSSTSGADLATSRARSLFGERIIYNRALTAAEVLSLSINGPALADRGASQTPVYESDFSVDVDGVTAVSGVTLTGNVDGIDGEDDWLQAERTGANGNLIALLPAAGYQGKRLYRFVKIYNPVGSGFTHFYVTSLSTAPAAPVEVFAISEGSSFSAVVTSIQERLTIAISPCTAVGGNLTVATGKIFYIKNALIKTAGLTSELLASNAQSDTGQIFDTSGNKNHALLPASGATVVGRPVSQTREVRWTNTWAGTNELQYIGGVNQAILPANAYIESIVGIVSGATPHDIIIGDGSGTDRYVTITTGLAAGTTSFTLANRTTDGTNLKLTVDPDTNATMSIAWVISYRTLES